jgi:hypothetical protein
MMRPISAVAAVIAALCIAPAAAAKEGVVARLTAPIATRPSGGVPVEFTLRSREDGRPFSATDIFARVRTIDGRTLEIWPEERFVGNFADPPSAAPAARADSGVPVGQVAAIVVAVLVVAAFAAALERIRRPAEAR